MHSYRNWNQQQHPQEVDITVDDSAHSPVIPIPVSSAPASTFISDPPSSAPEVFASPICPPAPSSTHAVTTSISDPPFATPEGHVQPSHVFEEIVERKFGSESVYYGNTWQSVLQTCNELNQIQTSKVQSILGKLNEVVSFLLLIELIFVQYFFVHVCVANKHTISFIYFTI